MATIDPGTLTADQLVPMLHAWAEGGHSDEAAVHLLAVHGTWLNRPSSGTPASTRSTTPGHGQGTAPWRQSTGTPLPPSLEPQEPRAVRSPSYGWRAPSPASTPAPCAS